MKRKVMKVLVSVVALCVLALMAAPKAFAQATLPPPLNWMVVNATTLNSTQHKRTTAISFARMIHNRRLGSVCGPVGYGTRGYELHDE